MTTPSSKLNEKEKNIFEITSMCCSPEDNGEYVLHHVIFYINIKLDVVQFPDNFYRAFTKVLCNIR